MVKERILGCLGSTTIKGMPQAMKSKTKRRQLLWFLVVFVLLAATVWQCYFLLTDFLTYPVNTVRKEVHRTTLSSYDEVSDHFNFSFPAVTVCNNRFFMEDLKYLPDNLKTATEYEELKSNFLRYASTHGYDRENMETHLSKYGYRIYTDGNMATNHIIQPWDEFNIFCFLTLEINGSVDIVHCNDEHIKIEPVIVQGKKQCFSIQQRIKMPMAQHDIFTMDLGFYLHNVASNTFTEDTLSNLLSPDPASLFVIIHNLGEVPNDIDHQILMAGQHYTVDVERTASVYMKPPYGECQDNTDDHLYSMTGDTYAYTQQGCWDARVTDGYLAACGCIHPYVDKSTEPIPKGSHFCGKIYPENFTRTAEEILCCNQIHVANLDKCKPNCVNQRLTRVTSNQEWMKGDRPLSFYNVVIKGTEKEKYFRDTYEPIAEMKRQGKYQEALKALGGTSLIRDNFVRLTVLYDKSSQVAIIDQAKYTGLGFLSSLGGVFNLYAGISAVLIFEVLELILDIVFMTLFPPEKKTKVESVKEVKTHAGF